MDDHRLLTAKLALTRAALTAGFLGVVALVYPWICNLLLPDGYSGDWPYLVWSVSLAACFPLVTVAERKLGPLRARHQALLLCSGYAFAFLWGLQFSHLTGLAEGKTHLQLMSAALETVKGVFGGPRSILFSLGWFGSLALPLLLLAHARRARAHLLIQVLAPAGVAILLEVGSRALNFWSLGINHTYGVWSFVFLVPKVAGCVGYALAGAWTDRSNLYQKET